MKDDQATITDVSPDARTAPSQTLTAEASEVAGEVTRYVVVEVNASNYGFPTDATVELMSSSVVAVTRVPKSPEFVRGVINHRGSIIPVVNTRRLLGLPSIETQARELIDTIDARERDHADWLEAMENSIRSGSAFDGQTNTSRAAFERWYAEIVSDQAQLEFLCRFDPNVRATLSAMDGPHQRIIRSVEKAVALREEGDPEAALALLDEERSSTLDKLGQLFANVRSAVESGIKTMLVITELGDRRAAFEVDAVHTVKDCADADIESLPDTATGSEFMRGLVHQGKSDYVLICDLEQMYGLACPS